MNWWRRIVDRRRRRRRDAQMLRIRAELRELVEEGMRRRAFEVECRRLLGELGASDAGRSVMAIAEYGRRAARENRAS